MLWFSKRRICPRGDPLLIHYMCINGKISLSIKSSAPCWSILVGMNRIDSGQRQLTETIYLKILSKQSHAVSDWNAEKDVSSVTGPSCFGNCLYKRVWKSFKGVCVLPCSSFSSGRSHDSRRESRRIKVVREEHCLGHLIRVERCALRTAISLLCVINPDEITDFTERSRLPLPLATTAELLTTRQI